MRYHLVAHRADPDGIIAHALLERALAKEQCEHYFVDYPDFHQTLGNLKEKKPGRVIVADMNLDTILQQSNLLSELREKHGLLEWYDHHSNSIQEQRYLEKQCRRVKVAANYCAAQLVREEYLPQDSYALSLAHLAHVHDFEKKEDSRAPIAYELQQKDQACQRLEESVEHRDIAGYTVAFALSDPLLYMKLAPEHLGKKIKVDCLVVLYEGKRNIIVEGYNRVGKHIPAFCTWNKGGGRGHGGGFTIDHEVTIDSVQNDQEQIARQLEEFFQMMDA
ncbi:hypothetical protein HYU22_04420 [Candidatus Woesearchaeota archaeon]|nr:hypothetical protein [Candidatus Woesearchaeota archaeon]